MDDNARKIADLERRVRQLESRLDELTRLLKRATDESVQRAARRAQS
jgi:hypothetical protein